MAVRSAKVIRASTASDIISAYGASYSMLEEHSLHYTDIIPFKGQEEAAGTL